MTFKNLEYIEAQTGIDPTWSVIWLHGLGADGHDFEPIVPELSLPASPAVRFIFPHAPMQPITINGGMSMRAWYDIKGMTFDREEDREGIEQSAQIVHALIDQENQRGIAADRIFLAGFSQGGAIALFTGLRMSHKLAGIVALSTYLPMRQSLAEEKSEPGMDIPIFMAHGMQDPVIPFALAEQSKNHLANLDYAIEWRTYNIQHSVCHEEIAEIGNFIRSITA